MVLASQDRSDLEKDKPAPVRRSGRAAPRLRPGFADYLAGETADFQSTLHPFLPQGLIGGSIPHVPGTEDDTVWNAAAQACGTEKVHFTYSIQEGRLWYIACPSSSLASAPDSWCPLAAALPGNTEFWDKETVYLYEQDGLASALGWDPDTGRMRVFLGAGRTLLSRMQSMDANFVTVDPRLAGIVPWKNRMMMTEKLSRAAANMLLYTGIGVSFILFVFLISQSILTNRTIKDFDEAKKAAQIATRQLMVNAYDALQPGSITHMVRLQKMLDDLAKIDGTLVKYEVNAGQVSWEVLVPPAYGKGIGSIQGQIQPGLEQDGRVRIKGPV